MLRRKWKEWYLTDSMQFQSRLAEQLAENSIKYKIRTVNRNRSFFGPDRRSFQGSLGLNLGVLYEYRFYVNPEDYEDALHILSKCYQVWFEIRQAEKLPLV